MQSYDKKESKSVTKNDVIIAKIYLNENEIKKTGLPYFIVKGFDDSRLNEAIKIVQSI